MRRQSLAFASLAMAAMALNGCGEDPGVQQGTVPFKGSNTAPLDPLSSQMKKQMQEKSYINKGELGDKPAGESKSTADSKTTDGPKPAGESKSTADSKTTDGPKPAGESKSTTDSKPAGESKPVGESKSATKGG